MPKAKKNSSATGPKVPKGKKKKAPGEDNLWPYKDMVPPLPEADKLSKSNVLQIECCSRYKIKTNTHIVDEKSTNDEVYQMFGEMLSQNVTFMRQWVQVFVLTHKRFVINLSKDYLKNQNMKPSEWLANTRTDGKADALSLFILCLTMDTHCFIHTKSGYLTTLKDDPQDHLEYTQCCNLHLSFLGSGNFIQHEIQTEIIAFEIFSLPEPIELDMATQPIAIGECTAEESETLDKLLQLGITNQSNKNETNAHKTESEKGNMPSTLQSDNTMTAETSENPSLPNDSAVPETSTCTDADNNKTTAYTEQNELPHTPDVNIQEDRVPVSSVDMDKMASSTSKEQWDVLQLQSAETSKKNDQA